MISFQIIAILYNGSTKSDQKLKLYMSFYSINFKVIVHPYSASNTWFKIPILRMRKFLSGDSCHVAEVVIIIQIIEMSLTLAKICLLNHGRQDKHFSNIYL